MNSPIHFKVPFEAKDLAKSLGARWDPSVKNWYMNSDNKNLEKMIDAFRDIILDIPYDSKDEAKELGAKWCIDKKYWYTYGGNPKLPDLRRLESA